MERVFARLKEDLNLKAVKARGMDNVRTHVTPSLITMMSVAPVSQKTNPDLATSINAFRY